MNVIIPSFSDIEDEDEEEIQVQAVVKPKPKSYAKFEPILKRKIQTLKENPFELDRGEKMQKHSSLVLELMRRAEEKYMEQIDNAWMDKQLTQMVGNNPDELEDLQFIMNYLLSLAKNVAFEKISQLKSDQLLQIRMRLVRLKVDELDRATARLTIQHVGQHIKEDTLRKRKNESRWEEPDRYLKQNDSDIGDIFAKSPSPEPQPSTSTLATELECGDENEAWNRKSFENDNTNFACSSDSIKSSNLNTSISCAHTSHIVLKKVIVKSCLKQYRRSDTVKISRKIKFIYIIVEKERKSPVVDNEGKSAKNPNFDDQLAGTLPGQQTLRFTIVSKPSQMNDGNDNDNDYMFVPSSDHKIKVTQRENPMIDSHSQQKKKIQSEINSELVGLLKMDAFYANRTVRHMFLVDSIMTPLREGIFKNLRFMHMGHPRMPQWFLESLDTWWEDSMWQPNPAPFYFTKIFICLGMDINIYFADPKAKPEQHIMDLLTKINKWFETKLDGVQRNYNANWEKSRHLLKLERTLKAGKDPDGKSYTTEFLHIRLAQKPKFVLITVPEVGHWHSFFITYNNQIRNFVKTNSPDFLLLDWAGILNDKPTQMWNTVEKRTRILLEAMNYEHGVLYE